MPTFGHVYSPREIARIESAMDLPSFASAGYSIRGTGRGKVVLLHEYIRKVHGRDWIVNQGSVGSCVAAGTAKALMALLATQIETGESGEYIAPPSIEAIYGLARVEVGGGRLGNQDGAIGAWAAKAVEDYGTLMMTKYGRRSLTRYNEERCRDWGLHGLPDELEPIAQTYVCRNASMVRSYEEAADAIANGYPVIVCSNIAFHMQRDQEGFARRDQSKQWPHCMAFIAVDDAHGRPGLLCDNSWGPKWIKGPKRHNQPDGSFWVHAATADAMLRQGDSWAFSGYKGFRKRKLNLRLTTGRKRRRTRSRRLSV